MEGISSQSWRCIHNTLYTLKVCQLKSLALGQGYVINLMQEQWQYPFSPAEGLSIMELDYTISSRSKSRP